MKILQPGETTRGKWWVGLVMECGHCGMKVVLEAEDEPLVTHNRCGINEVMLPCSCCGLEVIGKWAKPPFAQTPEEMLAIYAKFADGFKEGLKESLSRPPEGR